VHVVYDAEPIAAQPARLIDGGALLGQRAIEAVRHAVPPAVASLQVPARHVEHRLDIEVSSALPQLAERDVLGVAKKPSRLVVEGGLPLVERADPEGYLELPAMCAEAGAGRRGVTATLASAIMRCQIHGCQKGLVKPFTSSSRG
jgi:hypothetical protein